MGGRIIQGQSRYTRFKEERFAPIMSQSIRISKAVSIAQFSFYHVDLNAGSGFNEDVKVNGSPLNFLAAIDRNERSNYYAFFVDRDPGAIVSLTKIMENRPDRQRIAIFEADNSEILPVVSEFIARRERNPHYATGSILIDPNGYHGGVPWGELSTFCHHHPRFDVLMNLNIRTYKLERSQIKIGHGKWSEKQLRHPSTFKVLFGREHWMWTELCKVGQAGSSWMQFVGRSMDTNISGYHSLGFYDSRTLEAKQIISEVFDESSPDSGQLSLL